MGALGRLGIDVTISPGPSEVPDPIPFAEDRVHHSYEPADAKRFFHVLSQVDVVLKEHRSKFNGKTTPAQFFWGSFDHVVTRFSGRPVTPPESADTITRYGGDAEQICGGFWPGHPQYPSAAFFAYGYPKPDGIEQASIGPEGAVLEQRDRRVPVPLRRDAGCAQPATRAVGVSREHLRRVRAADGLEPRPDASQPAVVTLAYDVAAISPIAPDW